MKSHVFFSVLLALAVVLVLQPSVPLGAHAAEVGFGVHSPGLTPGKDYVEAQVIVGLHPGKQAGASRFVPPTQARVTGRIPGTAVLLQFKTEAAAQRAIQALLVNPAVRFVERNGFMSIPPLPPGPTKHGRQPRLSAPDAFNKRGTEVPNAQSVSADVGAAHQWHHTVIRKTVDLGALNPTPPTIAVIDTGVDYTHSDLSGKVINGKNCVNDTLDPYDDNGHGTHVAGLAAAAAGNGMHGEGVSHNSKIYAIKVLDYNGSGTLFQIACGMHDGHTAVTVPAIRVGNMSLGGPPSALLATEVTHWLDAGKLLVAAAGNSNTSTSPLFGTDPNIGLRVMATEESDCRTSFSNFSPLTNPTQYNIAAPGWELRSTMPGEGYAPLSGTSMAAPVVAGAAALVWGELPSLSRATLISRLVNFGKSISCGFAAGTRRVDVRRAIVATTETVLIGRVLDASSGQPPSPNTVPATVEVRDSAGTVILGSDLSNRGGFYEIFGPTLAGAARRIRAVKSGFVTDTLRTALTVSATSPTGPLTDAMHKSRPTGFFHGVVDWNTTQPANTAAGANTRGWDLDIGLRLPLGNFMLFGPEGDLTGPPFVMLERDSFDDFQPVEGFVIGSAAGDGLYRVFVLRNTGPTGLALASSRAQVRLIRAATPVLLTSAPACTETQPIWHVADVVKSGTSYTVTSVNICGNIIP